MPSLNRNSKFTCENCGTTITGFRLARHKKRCSVRSVYCSERPSFSSKSQSDLNYHIAKNHSAPKPAFMFKCKLFYQKFPGFYALRQHKNTQESFSIKTAIVHPDVLINEVYDTNLKEELRSCQHFLVDSELESARHEVFNYAMDNLNATVVDDKLDHFLNSKKCATKVNLCLVYF